MEPDVNIGRSIKANGDVLSVYARKNRLYAAVGTDASSFRVENLLGDFRGTAAIHDDFYTMRGPAHLIGDVGVVLIRSYGLHTLHILQNGAPDALQHGRGPAVNLVDVRLPELRVGFSETPSDVGSHIGDGFQPGDGFHYLRDNAVRDKDVSVLLGAKLDDAAYRFGGQVLREYHRVGTGFIHRLNSELPVSVANLKLIIGDGRSKGLQRACGVQLGVEHNTQRRIVSLSGKHDHRLIERRTSNLPIRLVRQVDSWICVTGNESTSRNDCAV